MSTAQRALFALLALAAVGGVGFLLLDEGADSQAPELTLGGPSTPRMSSAATLRAGESGPTAPILRTAAPRDEDDPDGTSLTVLVVDGNGRPLPEATIRLRGEEGASVEGQGALVWPEATPGPWALTVEAEGLISFRREVVVEAGARARVTAQLRDHVRLEGRVLDVYGRPVEDQVLWLLEEGRAHPAKGEKTKGWPFAVSSPSGEFVLHAPTNGTYRISVGPIGEEVLTSAPLVVQQGGRDQLEVVVPSRGLLEVDMDALSPGLQEGRVVLRVAVLKRRKNFTPEEAAAEVERPRRREGGRRDRGESEEASPPEDTAPDADRGEWKEIAIFPLDQEGRTVFDDLPVGADLRLVFQRKNDRFESQVPFVLMEGRRSVAKFAMPPKRTPAEIEAQPVGTFYPAILVEPGKDALRAGVRFLE